MSGLLAPFSDPAAVARYAEGPPRFVPGFADLHRMTSILLAEHAPANARVLVLGAGGGLELKAFAQAHPRWTFDGVDPAPEMLKLAKQALGPLAARVQLHEGLIDDAPDGPFDAATCLLTLHFLPAGERKRTAHEIRRRLRPARRSSPRIPAFRRRRASVRIGSSAMPLSHSDRGPILPKRRRCAPRSKRICRCSVRSRTKRSCATQAFRA